jgi:hypothetical protein
VVAWRNWHTLLTENAISGLVRVNYCNAPTMLLYLVLSSGPRNSPSVTDAYNGVGIVLHLFNPTLLSKSEAHFSWINIIPRLNLFTSIPKKKCRSLRSFNAKAELRS